MILARLTTLSPGWYPGRTVHIHFKIGLPAASGVVYDFTSQLYFADSFSDEVFTRPPYPAQGARNTRNANDGIYGNGGDQLTLLVEPSGEGYSALFDMGLQLD